MSTNCKLKTSNVCDKTSFIVFFCFCLTGQQSLEFSLRFSHCSLFEAQKLCFFFAHSIIVCLFLFSYYALFFSSAALNYKLLTIHGLDETGKLHGVYLNGKTFLSCEYNGGGACNVGQPETWYEARDRPNTITAIEVPIIAETGLDATDLPRSLLVRKDSVGRYWGGNNFTTLLQALQRRHCQTIFLESCHAIKIWVESIRKK